MAKNLKRLGIGLVLAILLVTSLILGMSLQVTRTVKAEEKGIVLKNGFLQEMFKYYADPDVGAGDDRTLSRVASITIKPNSSSTPTAFKADSGTPKYYNNIVDTSSQYYDSNCQLSFEITGSRLHSDLTIYCTGAVIFEGDMSGLFQNLEFLQEVDIRGVNTTHCTSMASWFIGDYSLSAEKIYGLNDLDTSNCTNFSQMFFNVGHTYTPTQSVTLDISNFVIKAGANTENMLPSEGNASISSMKLPKHPDRAFLKGYDRRWQTWLDLDTNKFYYGLGEIPTDRVVHVTRYFDETHYTPYQIVDTTAAPKFRFQALQNFMGDTFGKGSYYYIREIHFCTNYTGVIDSSMIALDPQHRYEDYWKSLKDKNAPVNQGGYTESHNYIDWSAYTEDGTAYASYDNNAKILTLYTPASKFIMPNDASHFFENFHLLAVIDSLSSLDFTNTTDICFLFSEDYQLCTPNMDLSALDNGVGYSSVKDMFSGVHSFDMSTGEQVVLDLTFIRGGSSADVLESMNMSRIGGITLPKEYRYSGSLKDTCNNGGWYDTIDKKYYKDANTLPDGEHKLVAEIGGLFVDVEPLTVQGDVISNTGEKYSEQAVIDYIKSQVETIQTNEYYGEHTKRIIKGNTETTRWDTDVHDAIIDNPPHFDATNIKLQKIDNYNAYIVYYNVGETVNQTAVYFGEPIVAIGNAGVENPNNMDTLKTDSAVNRIKMVGTDGLLDYGSTEITSKKNVGLYMTSIRTEDNDTWVRDFVGYVPYSKSLNTGTDLKEQDNRLYIQLENADGSKTWYKTNICNPDCPDPVYTETIVQEPSYELEGKRLLVNKQNDKAHYETIAKLVKPAIDDSGSTDSGSTKPSDSGNTKPSDSGNIEPSNPDNTKPSDSGSTGSGSTGSGSTGSGNIEPSNPDNTKPADTSGINKPSDSDNTKPSNPDSIKPTDSGSNLDKHDIAKPSQGTQALNAQSFLGAKPTEVVSSIKKKASQGISVITSAAKAPLTGDSYIDIPLKIIALLSGSSLILLVIVKKLKDRS